MLEDAITFPTRSEDWIQTVVIGGVLSLLGFLILPTVIVYGYLLRAMRAGATDAPPPSFTEWGELLVDGLKLFVLVLAASLLVTVPVVLLAGIGMAGAGLTGSRIFAGVVGLGLLLVVLAVSLVLAYVLPAAAANFAIEGSFGAAFDAGTVLDGAMTGEYATAWLLALLVGFVGATVGGPLTVVVVGAFLVFYTQVVGAYLIGRGFAAGTGRAPDAPAPTAGGGRTPTVASDEPVGGAGDRTGTDAESDPVDDPEPPGFGQGTPVEPTDEEAGDGADRGTRDGDR